MVRKAQSVAIVVVVIAVCGCVKAPREADILIASKPGDATVTLDGAELGTTPLKLKVRGETVLDVELEGYETQQVAISPGSDPNVIVELEEIVPVVEVVESAETTTVQRSQPSGPRYTTMRQIKYAYREGDISRVQYDEYKRAINRRRQVELDQAKADYRAGKLTEGKYKKRVRAIKDKYEG
jgi:hypothetical protein